MISVLPIAFQTRHRAGWTFALVVLLLSTLTGCPVYETRETVSATNCAPGQTAQAGGRAEMLECGCKDKFQLVPTGAPIPGMDSTAEPRRGGTVRIHLDANLPSLNRLKDTDAWIRRIVHHKVYQALVRQDARDYTFQPELATAWEVNELGTEWTFHLRKGVTWHDGKPFTSQDVKTTFDIILNPGNRTEVLRGEWQDVLDPRRPYEAPDDHTFIIRLKQPLAVFLTNLEDVTIVPAHIFGRGDFNTHPNLRIPVGTGPYRFKEWTADAIVIERNQEYWGPPGYIDTLIYRIVTDRDTAFAMTRRGDIDFMWRLMPTHRTEGITPDVLEKFRLIDLLPSNDYGFWIFNVQRPQFADVRVRKAMSYLIDRERIICEIYQCLGAPVTGPIPRNHPGHDSSIPSYPFDPTEAARLLSEAGWEDRDEDGVREKLIDGQVVPLSMTFMLTQSSRALEQVVTVVQNAARRVGVDIQITKIDWSVFTDRLRKFDFDVASFIYGGVHEPDLYSTLHTKGGQNYGRWSNPELDAIADKIRFISDETIRKLALRRAHAILHEEQPYAFTYVQAVPALIRKDIKGVYTSDLWYQDYDWWIDDPSFPIVPPEQRHPAPGVETTSTDHATEGR